MYNQDACETCGKACTCACISVRNYIVTKEMKYCSNHFTNDVLGEYYYNQYQNVDGLHNVYFDIDAILLNHDSNVFQAVLREKRREQYMLVTLDYPDAMLSYYLAKYPQKEDLSYRQFLVALSVFNIHLANIVIYINGDPLQQHAESVFQHGGNTVKIRTAISYTIPLSLSSKRDIIIHYPVLPRRK